MDLDQLRTFVAAVEAGSLTGAARERHLTQPAVSLQIRALEQDLECSVFHRRGRGVTLTRAGEALHARAVEILAAVRAARGEVTEVMGAIRGTLGLGVTDAAATRLLPEAFARFHADHPGVEVRVAVHPTAVLGDLLRRGEIDLAIGTLPPSAGKADPGIQVQPLATETLGLVIPKTKGKVSLSRALEGQPFIAYPRGSTTRGLIDAALVSAGLEARPRMEIGRPDVMIRLVEAGFGVTVLPLDVSEGAFRRGTVHRPSPRRFKAERRLGSLRLADRELEPAARAFHTVLLRAMG